MNRKPLIVALVIVVFIGGLVVVLYQGREPRYQGRTLSQWMSLYEKSEPFDRERQVAEEAIKHMAPEAIPWFVSWVQARSSPFKTKLRSWFFRHPGLLFEAHSPSFYHYRAFLGFQILGWEAKPAWPALVELTSSPDAERRAMGLVALQLTHPDRETFLPVLLRLINDSDSDVQSHARAALSAYYPEEATAAGGHNTFPTLTNQVTRQTIPPVR